jgi:hypothetical protein
VGNWICQGCQRRRARAAANAHGAGPEGSGEPPRHGPHLKSSKTMVYLSHILVLHTWLHVVTWSFGCPGHGKGPWDGLGAVMLRTDTKNKTCLTTSKSIKTVTDVVEHLTARFDTDKWQQDHECGTINRIGIEKADWQDIARPEVDYLFESIYGMRKSFGFMCISPGLVDYRECDCWCPPCCMSGGHGRGIMSVDSVLTGCHHGGAEAHKWFQCDVSRKDTRGVRDRRKVAQAKGHEDVKKLKPAQWVAVQNRGVTDNDPYLVGRVVGKDRAALTRKVESREKAGETLYSSGDYLVAVRW